MIVAKGDVNKEGSRGQEAEKEGKGGEDGDGQTGGTHGRRQCVFMRDYCMFLDLSGMYPFPHRFLY